MSESFTPWVNGGVVMHSGVRSYAQHVAAYRAWRGGDVVTPVMAFSKYIANNDYVPGRIGRQVAHSDLTAEWLYTYREHVLGPCGGRAASPEGAWELVLQFKAEYDALGVEYATALYGEVRPLPSRGRFHHASVPGTSNHGLGLALDGGSGPALGGMSSMRRRMTS